jgi:Sel1 repeat
MFSATAKDGAMKMIIGKWGITALGIVFIIGAAMPVMADTPWGKIYMRSAAALAAGNYDEALPGFRALADVGSPAAEATLGHIYLNGLGVARNPRTAAVWYFRASEKGYAPAQFVLGHMFARGIGFARNDERAYFWLKLASIRADTTLTPKIEVHRKQVVALLTPAQISVMDKRAAVWRPSAAVPR